MSETLPSEIHVGLAHRVMHKGEWGYQAASYLGGHVVKHGESDDE